jgi:hypothetical protein
MPTNNVKTKDAFYAVVGVGDVAFEKVKVLAGDVRTFVDKNNTPRTFVAGRAKDLQEFFSGKAGDLQKRITKRRRTAMRTYDRLAKRGQSLVSRIRRQAATQRATEQARNAQRQVKRTVKTVRKAATSTAEATVAAAQKVG